MSVCKNSVTQFVERGFGYKEIKSRCGTTGVHGQQLMCDECIDKYNKMYPQGWRDTPGDVCEHGTYVGDAYGPDYFCGQCEDGI